MKKCTKCGRKKALIAFSKRSTAKDGKQGTCQECQNKQSRARYKAHPEKQRAHNARYYQVHRNAILVYHKVHYWQNRAYYRNHQLKAKYGITVTEFDTMRRRQKDCCALCKQPMTFGDKVRPLQAVVDHCHKTGRIRGLIHARCNTLLARAEDSIVRLKQAIRYLRRK
ncbi:hypothetical protein LCGC14_0399650 [marine sediment metagenome]|uniref:Recombination endonuclease VII n=1 Tax=marine sediment metagenome TaxID=412755 RepID=A0A0F9W661_9ZZZZ